MRDVGKAFACLALFFSGMMLGQIGERPQKMGDCTQRIQQPLEPLKVVVNSGEPYMAQERRKILWLARAIYGEAHTALGSELVGEVIMNRVDHEKFQDRIIPVVRKEWAFESITENARQLDTLQLKDSGPEWRLAKRHAMRTYTKTSSERSLRATHFYSPRAMPPHKPRPSWAYDREPERVVSDQYVFYVIHKQSG